MTMRVGMRVGKQALAIDDLNNEANEKLVKSYAESDLRKIARQQDKLSFIEEIHWALTIALRDHDD